MKHWVSKSGQSSVYYDNIQPEASIADCIFGWKREITEGLDNQIEKKDGKNISVNEKFTKNRKRALDSFLLQSSHVRDALENFENSRIFNVSLNTQLKVNRYAVAGLCSNNWRYVNYTRKLRQIYFKSTSLIFYRFCIAFIRNCQGNVFNPSILLLHTPEISRSIFQTLLNIPNILRK